MPYYASFRGSAPFGLFIRCCPIGEADIEVGPPNRHFLDYFKFPMQFNKFYDMKH